MDWFLPRLLPTNAQLLAQNSQPRMSPDFYLTDVQAGKKQPLTSSVHQAGVTLVKLFDILTSPRSA